MWRGDKNKGHGKSGSLYRVEIKQDKGVFRASTDSPNYTVRQRRSGLLKGVTFSALCYLLYSKLPDFTDLKRFSMNTRSVTERKNENGQRFKKNRTVYQSGFAKSL